MLKKGRVGTVAFTSIDANKLALEGFQVGGGEMECVLAIGRCNRADQLTLTHMGAHRITDDLASAPQDAD